MGLGVPNKKGGGPALKISSFSDISGIFLIRIDQKGRVARSPPPYLRYCLRTHTIVMTHSIHGYVDCMLA